MPGRDRNSTSPLATSTTTAQPAHREQLYTVKPLHVLLVGAGILGSGVLLTGTLLYRQAGKQLAAEGIDASVRRRILPHALKALAGSLLLTGAAAGGCFYVMESVGLVNHESPTSSSTLQTAVDMMLNPTRIQGSSRRRSSSSSSSNSSSYSSNSSKRDGDGDEGAAVCAVWCAPGRHARQRREQPSAALRAGGGVC